MSTGEEKNLRGETAVSRKPLMVPAASRTQSGFWHRVKSEETKRRKKEKGRAFLKQTSSSLESLRLPVVVLSLGFSRPPTHPRFCSAGSEVLGVGSGALIEIHPEEKRVRRERCVWGEHSQGSGRNNADPRDPRPRLKKQQL